MTMHIEHEEAMREAYTELDRLKDMVFRPEATEADIHRLYTDGAAIDQGWHYGPHSEHWNFLKEAHARWASEPEVMRRALTDSYQSGGLDSVARRSVIQAGLLSGAHPCRPAIERERER
ncbi:hypothetical protein ACFQZZ_14900 [Nocardia sp. GCM10030253]|uniref:hypothetical protein n=1 Tax=Nocardia sp. GCM10030253 TaxID=3273404 RepID=UPI003630348B